ncbi:hypothetical protein [Alkalihalobacterium chitinilyticum]|uniref:Uncharacterized protein n=1 Tax=Alkalihalobacterium chitinilyticum TaxID=2980103 RepID=A0ABT5V8S5_9BACI|nr:hypothetical protein [Alkalihalobacterium chitinilyticum]MDE5411836.1 hypothetical protein [Alkalihalobacterium chitinilyticum]
MQKLAILIVLTVTMLTFTACQDRPEDITQSIEKQHMRGADGIEPLHPSNKDQNKTRRDVTENAVSYASEFGYYLNQLYAHLEPLNNLFYTENPTETDVHEAREHVQNAQDWSEYILSLDTPPEFVNLYIGHSSTLLELDSLMKSLEDMDLNDEVDFRRARLYYENTIIAVKSMEREYKGVLEEHGIK